MTAITSDTARSRRTRTVTGTWTLLRLALRRDRIRLPAWTVGVTGFVVGSAIGLGDVVPDDAARATRAELMSSPTIRALRGPGYGLDDYTYGAMVSHELLLLSAVAVALMSILVVTRHTRAEEEAGRTELLRAGVLGRHAGIVAALTLAVVANLVIGALTTAGLVGGIAELEVAGAALFGLSMAAAGIVFAGVGAMCVQLTEHSRGANGLGGILLAVAFVLRAIGDTGGVDDRTLSWLSPLGWTQSTRAFVDDRMWPLGLSLALLGVSISLAFALASRRDLGAGYFPSRPGPATASGILVRPWGLAWRLQRTSLFGWTIGAALLGASFGSIVGDIDVFLTDNPHLVDIFGAGGGRLLDAFLATVMLLVALLGTGFGLQSALRLRSEETDGRTEPLLATSLSRTRWMTTQLTLALVGAAIVTTAGGLGLGASAAIDQGDAGLVTDLLAAGLAYVPAIWLTIGLVAAAYGLWPRAIGVGWLVIAYAAFVGLLAEVLDLPEPVRSLSPYRHVPELPAADLDAAALTSLTLIAVGLLVAGVAGFSRRDIHTT